MDSLFPQLRQNKSYKFGHPDYFLLIYYFCLNPIILTLHYQIKNHQIQLLHGQLPTQYVLILRQDLH